MEPTGPKGRRRRGAGRTDYLLCVQAGDMPKPLPVAVLEAKRSDADPLKGMEQAKGYADYKPGQLRLCAGRGCRRAECRRRAPGTADYVAGAIRALIDAKRR